MSTALTIRGMTCGACTSRVQRALEAVPGVSGAEVALPDRASVAGNAGMAALVEAVETAGFEVAGDHELLVHGMTCGACTSRLTRMLEALPGVSSARVSLPDRASVWGEVDRSSIEQAVADAGFSVVGVEVLEPLEPPGPTPVVEAAPAEGLGTGDRRVSLAVHGMHCASCVSTVEEALLTVDGVVSAYVNLASNRATVSMGEGAELPQLRAAIERVGYRAPVAREGESSWELARREREEEQAALTRDLGLAAPLTAVVTVLAMTPRHFS